jgi:general secretion pathway protein M
MTADRFANRASILNVAALAGYVTLIVIGLVLTWTAVSSVVDARASLSAAQTMLAELEGRSRLRPHESGGPLRGAPAGSPFLGGSTLNVAAAALLQRVGAVVHKVGGNVVSSQVDLDSARSKNGWIGLTVSCNVQQASLQPLLYDLEAGMPFLFIDQLVVQAPTPGVNSNQMRVLLGVSGQWWSGK